MRRGFEWAGAAAFTLLVIVAALSVSPVIAAAIVVATPLIFVVAKIPNAWLPSLALVAYAVIPEKLYSASEIVKAVSVGTVLLIAWFVRGMAAKKTTRGRFAIPIGGQLGTIAAVALFLWFVLLLAFGTSAGASPGWTISFSAAALLPFFYRNYSTEGVHLRTAAAWVGSVIGAFAIIETAIGANPLFDAIYRAFGMSNSQHWSVYRAEAASGHPLYAATLLAACSAIALGAWLESDRGTSKIFLLGASALAAGGVVATVSRGGIAALAGAFAVVVCFSIFRGGRGTVSKILGLGILGVGAYFTLDLAVFAQRGASNEAGQSADARQTIIDLAIITARSTGWLGAGPGGSQLAVEAATGTSLLVESSPLQLLVSIGIPGLALLAVLAGVMLANIFRRANTAALGGIIAFAIATTGYNALDALRTIHVLLGCLVILALAPTASALRADREAGALMQSSRDRGAAAARKARQLSSSR